MSVRFLAALLTIAALSLPAPPATAASYTFEATLTGPNEEPPNDSPGTGFARVILDTIAHTLEVYAEFAGLVAPTTVAHIHAPTALPFTGNVGVAVQPPTLTGFPGGVTAGTYLNTFDTSDSATYSLPYLTVQGFGDPLVAEAALLGHLMSGRAYFNIHSTAYPPGEIRGFFRPPVPIPLPAALPVLLAALGTLVLLRRRSRA
ncbi:CHRD domain-containing protein [Pararhodobacter sp. SW119]|uniref:CHRD domain-containing protein n=1 Tax=Pararhodobacter sp. SW119 TaxID=2780075 RepID=UPI001AE02164|nr:CHRD domain-containing protein [Pararhodobacter sp. SW119]